MQKDFTETEKDFQRNKLNSFILKYLFPKYFTFETFDLIDLLTKCTLQSSGAVTEGYFSEKDLLINYQVIEEPDPILKFLVGAPLNSGYFNLQHSAKNTVNLFVKAGLISPDSMTYLSKSYYVNPTDLSISVNSAMNIPFNNPHPSPDEEKYEVLTKYNNNNFEITLSSKEYLPAFVDI